MKLKANYLTDLIFTTPMVIFNPEDSLNFQIDSLDYIISTYKQLVKNNHMHDIVIGVKYKIYESQESAATLNFQFNTTQKNNFTVETDFIDYAINERIDIYNINYLQQFTLKNESNININFGYLHLRQFNLFESPIFSIKRKYTSKINYFKSSALYTKRINNFNLIVELASTISLIVILQDRSARNIIFQKS